MSGSSFVEVKCAMEEPEQEHDKNIMQRSALRAIWSNQIGVCRASSYKRESTLESRLPPAERAGTHKVEHA